MAQVWGWLLWTVALRIWRKTEPRLCCRALMSWVICMADGQDIRASVIVVERGTVAYLWGMYVHPSCQRQGLGSILLKGVASEIATSSDIEIRALSTSSSAISLYRKHGFVKTGTEDTELTGAVSAKTLIMSVSVERLKAMPLMSSL